jgi:hypothetical protein
VPTLFYLPGGDMDRDGVVTTQPETDPDSAYRYAYLPPVDLAANRVQWRGTASPGYNVDLTLESAFTNCFAQLFDITRRTGYDEMVIQLAAADDARCTAKAEKVALKLGSKTYKLTPKKPPTKTMERLETSQFRFKFSSSVKRAIERYLDKNETGATSAVIELTGSDSGHSGRSTQKLRAEICSRSFC